MVLNRPTSTSSSIPAPSCETETRMRNSSNGRGSKPERLNGPNCQRKRRSSIREDSRTSMPSVSKKRARGEWCWEMQVIACGGGCCAPLQDRHECKGKIEQGHIVAEAEGGGDNPDNLIPLCES